MADERTDRILHYLESQGLRECLICGGVRFGVGEEYVLIKTENPEPSQGSAVVPVMCANCGYMMLFSTRRLPSEGQQPSGINLVALVGLEDLLRTFGETPPGAPKVDYIGVNMGEGGTYPLIRL